MVIGNVEGYNLIFNMEGKLVMGKTTSLKTEPDLSLNMKKYQKKAVKPDSIKEPCVLKKLYIISTINIFTCVFQKTNYILKEKHNIFTNSKVLEDKPLEHRKLLKHLRLLWYQRLLMSIVRLRARESNSPQNPCK